MTTTPDNIKQGKILPFHPKRGIPDTKSISLIDAASYIRSFVRADLLKLLEALREESLVKQITTEDINRLIEGIHLEYQ